MRLGWLNSRKGPLRVLMPGLRRLPPRTALRVIAGLARAEYALDPMLRRRLREAVRRGDDHFGAGWDVASVAPELAIALAQWRARDRLLDGVEDRAAGDLLRAEGREHLDAAMAGGKGVILLVNHYGACFMPGHWLVRNGYPLRWLTERPRNVSRILSRDFGDDGPLGQGKLFLSRRADGAEAANAIRRAARILKAGMIVKAASDVRWTGARTASADFLGRTYRFTTTWAKLAAMTSAPVVQTFGRIEPDGRYVVEFLPHFFVPADAGRSGEGFAPWVQKPMDALAERIRRWPANSGDYLFWDEPGEGWAESA